MFLLLAEVQWCFCSIGMVISVLVDCKGIINIFIIPVYSLIIIASAFVYLVLLSAGYTDLLYNLVQ